MNLISFPTLDELTARHTMKWTRYPSDVLPLWVAESDFATCPPIKKALQAAVENESFGYQPDGSALPAATADFYRNRYGFDAKPEWIFAVPDVVRALYVAISHFTAPGSKVIVPVPAYPPFFQLLSATGREGVFLDARGGLDLDQVEQAFRDGAGSILLCNPHNPLGYTFKQDYLIELAELADRYGARVLVDEIHAPLVYDGAHVVAAGVSATAAKVCITATATSKAWNTAGLKCAQIIFSNEDDVRKWNQLSPVIRDGVSTLGLIAAEVAYTEGLEFLEQELDYLKANRDFVARELPRRIPGVKVPHLEATYLLWLDFTETTVPGNPSQFFIEHAKVAMNDGEFFGEIGRGHTRLNIATSREILTAALDRMEAAYAAL
ncbi:MalY/PatB family protein [Corynebacterium sp. SCR221107]|uniref:MalY/PatB family protein n=1 Tax=Corynebacterium sp. SCR221107 TaxID=3017361 RepID=UPI003FA49D9F